MRLWWWCGLLAVGVAACGSGDQPGPVRVAAPAALPVPVPVAAFVFDLGFDGGQALAVTDDAPCAIRAVQASGELSAAKPSPRCTVVAAAFRPGSRTLARFRSREDGIRLAAGQRRIRIPDSALDEPRAFWSPDGRRLIVESEGWSGGVVFSVATGRRLRSVVSSGAYLGRQPFSPDGKRVVSGDRRGLVVTAVASGARRRVPLPDGAERPAWSPVGERVAAQSGRAVAWVDLATGETRSAPVAGVYEVAWSPDGRLIAAYHALADDQWAVSVIDAATGAVSEIHRFPQGAERAEFAWSPDGSKLAFQVAQPL